MSDIFEQLAAGHDEEVTQTVGNVTYHWNLLQGTEAWLEARRGVLTASEIKLILTKTLKVASNDKSRAHVYELLAQRISGHVEPTYQSDDMLRGNIEEIEACKLYGEHVAPVQTCGFVTNSKWGFTLGYSPDRLVGEDGQVEVKGRRQKFQFQTICEHIYSDKHGIIPDDFSFQVQTGLMVTEREWCDFISYSNGLPMTVIRVHPDEKIMTAIQEAATNFETDLAAKKKVIDEHEGAKRGILIPTERKEYTELLT